MGYKRNESADSEVVGIVISSGHLAPAEPRFSMYVWAPAPDAEPDTTTKAA